jgi:hypothetical protein
MKSLGRFSLLTFAIAVLSSILATETNAGLITSDWDWANQVVEYTSNIQNYAGTSLGPSTTWWLTGEPDGNDGDYVAGWRSSAPDETITMYWEAGIADLEGDDLVVSLFSGSKASANILASVDGVIFTEIGVIGSSNSTLREEYFDFDGLFSGEVSYIQVERVGNGPQTGIFFDAFGGAISVPEPASIALLLMGAAMSLCIMKISR